MEAFSTFPTAVMAKPDDAIGFDCYGQAWVALVRSPVAAFGAPGLLVARRGAKSDPVRRQNFLNRFHPAALFGRHVGRGRVVLRSGGFA